ncbi:MAG: response regulator [bacterium]
MAYEILYIDDSDAMQKTVSMIFLNNSEFKITPLYDGSSLITVLNKSIPSIIIINYNISNAISCNMIKEIKNNSSYSNIPILLAAPSDLPNRERELFVEAGLDGFIYRPFDKETFINKIKRSLGLNINEDKIYDIAEFEKKTEDDNNNQNIESKKPEYLTGNFANDSKTPINTDQEQDFENMANDSSDTAINKNPKQDSAELSEAFENLFKDDNIFKEFQNLNKENDKINDSTIDNFNYDRLSASENSSDDSNNAATEITVTSEVIQPEFESVRNIETGINYEDREMLKNQQADTGDAIIEIETDKYNEDGINQNSGNDTKISIETEGYNEDSDDNDNDNDNKINEYMSKIIINEDIGDGDNIRSINFINNNSEENTNAEDEDTSDISILESSDSANQAKFNINTPEVYDIQESNRDDDNSIVNFKDNTNEKYKGGGIKLEFLNDEFFGKIDEYLKKSIDDMINGMKPEIVENIKNILPEIAEKLIKEEINKIKNENI